jgi:uncharacterized protein YecE (DUF72 family)
MLSCKAPLSPPALAAKVAARTLARPRPSQPTLFELPQEPLAAAKLDPEHLELAARVGDSLRLGTMSWSYPGWRDIVYGANADVKQLAERGLTAYARHPLLRAVEIDRSYYEPLSPAQLRSFAEQVPASFRFVVKAHEDCVVRRFPAHPRYGKKRGEANERYLDAGYAADAVVGPIVEGLGEKLGAVLFQFPPQDVGGAASFARRLEGFLAKLPRGPVYAIELRNRELFSGSYVEALAASGAVHCHNVWGEMSSVLTQARAVPPIARRPLVVRWLMRRGDDYQTAGERYKPFSRIVDEDSANRHEIAHLVGRALTHGVDALVLLDNKAEGCAPETAVRLARAIVRQREAAASEVVNAQAAERAEGNP